MNNDWTPVESKLDSDEYQSASTPDDGWTTVKDFNAPKKDKDLGVVGKTVNTVESFAKGLNDIVDAVGPKAGAYLGQALGINSGADKVIADAKSIQNTGSLGITGGLDKVQPDGLLGKTAYVAGQLPVYAATGGVAGAGVVGALQGGANRAEQIDQYEQQTGQHLSGGERAASIGGSAALNAGAALLPMGRFTGAIPGLAGGALKRTVGDVVGGSALGAGLTLGENANTRSYDDKQNLTEGVVESAGVGALLAGGAGAYHGVTQPAKPRTDRTASLLGLTGEDAAQPTTPDGHPVDRLTVLQNLKDQTDDPDMQKFYTKKIKEEQLLQTAGSALDEYASNIEKLKAAGMDDEAQELINKRQKLQDKVVKITQSRNEAATPLTLKTEDGSTPDDTTGLTLKTNNESPSAEAQVGPQDVIPTEPQPELSVQDEGTSVRNKLVDTTEQPETQQRTPEPVDLPLPDRDTNQMQKALSDAFDKRAQEGQGLGKQEYLSKLKKYGKGNEELDRQETIKDQQLNSDEATNLTPEEANRRAELEYQDFLNSDDAQFQTINGTTRKPALPRAIVEGTVKAATEQFKNGPRVHVVDTPNQFPEYVKSHPSFDPARVRAVNTRDGIYIAADRITNVNQIKEAVFHEQTHASLRSKFGKGLTDVLDRIVDTRGDEVKNLATERNLDHGNKEHMRAAAEELLANLGQKDPKNNFVQEAVAVIKAKLREYGLLSKAKLSDAEIIREYLKPARDAATQEFKSQSTDKALPDAQFQSEADREQKATDNMVKVFHDKDLAPKLKEAVTLAKASWDSILKVTSPQLRSGAAKQVANIIRNRNAEFARDNDRIREGLKSFRDLFHQASPEAGLQFIKLIEDGKKQPTPKLQKIADTVKLFLDRKYKEASKLDPSFAKKYVENYFPHIWKDPQEAAKRFNQLQRNRKLQGSKAFTKDRVIPTIEEGLAMGLELVSNNPMDIVLNKAMEIDKFVMGQNVVRDMHANGLTKYIREGEVTPLGMRLLDTTISNIFIPEKSAEIAGNQSIGVSRNKKGGWYVPEDVAQVLNNHLAPGLRSRVPIFDAYLGVANILNQAQLGLSAFHLGFTSLDAMTSQLAIALQHGIQDKNWGKMFKEMAEVPGAAITNAILGAKVRQEWYQPGTHGQEIADIVNALVKAGGRVTMDKFYVTNAADKMVDAFKQGNVIGGILRGPAGILDYVSSPIMNHLVPMQKLGVFAKMAQRELANMPHDVTPEVAKERLGKLWDSVDNRMGQMVYDNLFWNKAVKDLTLASVRSVGWNAGTFREIGGGAIDTAKQIKNLTTGQKAEFTSRMAYCAAMPVMAGLLGSFMTWCLTGSPPKDMLDMYFPNTGERDSDGKPLRLSLPSYMKDIVEYTHQPGTTLVNKLNPAISSTHQMLANKDFYGTEIRHPGDSYEKQGLDILKFVGKQFVPFGIRNMLQNKNTDNPLEALKQTSTTDALGFAGFPHAPKWLEQTKAEQVANELMVGHLPNAARTQEEFNKAQTRKQIVSGLLSQDPEKVKTANDLLQSEHAKGNLTPRQMDNIHMQTTTEPLVYRLKQGGGLTPDDSMKIWEAANEHERDQIREIVRGKIMRSTTLPADRKQLYLKQLSTGSSQGE